ncbi:MAG: hypothetical protein ABL893_04585 [Hyphomicrobium sp.]
MDGNDTPGRGQPTKYDPAYCERVIEMAKEGRGVAEWAAAFDVTKPTIYNWKEAHPDFFDAITRAEIHLQAWWENAGRTGMVSDKFNATVWAKNMNCRFREDWRDQTDVNLKVIPHEDAIKALE